MGHRAPLRPSAEETAPHVSTGPLAGSASGGGLVASGDADEMPRIVLTRRRVVGGVIFAAALAAFLYFGLPQIAGLDRTVGRIRQGETSWLLVAALFEVFSYLSYNAIFRAVMVRDHGRIDWSESFQITLAAVLATRLFNAAGAGGVALTAWALRRSGMEPRVVACRMVAFLMCLYLVYMLALIVTGVGLFTGALPGGGGFAITVVPAIFGAVAIAVFMAISRLPRDFERRLESWADGRGRVAQLARKLATAPASVASGVRTAVDLVRARRPGLLGAVGWWGFDIATLWACFHAFGDPPSVAIVIMAYFVGTLGNLLPLPGGVGGVEGGMVGAFAALGVDFDLALISVLAYRGFSFWLPTIPGAVAYLSLRRTVSRWRESDPLEASPVPTYTK